MSEQNQREGRMTPEKNELSEVLEKLLEYQKGNGDKNTLIMLSLLNLLGIVDSIKSQGGVEAGGGSTFSGQMPFNPAMLLNLLGGGQGKGQGFDISSLMGLLSSLLGGMPGGGVGMTPQSPPQNTAPAKDPVNPPVGKSAGKMKVEKNVKQQENKSEKQVKPESKNNADNTAKKPKPVKQEANTKNPEVIKWDFGCKEKE